ncbi:response regulator [Fuerstiella marisgermanici]|uniref:Cell cycle response regulator CtrA n=1 Tax=Fuerstiella marisgermanici TaxID=1891926 RepID=A0A1P8WI51_9PLAN|nr:response regulator [Fuerstiella marisgermanici]APZ93734.1 Cell cycle response regulator CtrA [Fuerstiella marisgermanici]
MGAFRPRLVVSGDSDETERQFRSLMGDDVEVVRPGAGQGDADGMLFTGGLAKRTHDLELCARGFLDSVPDALVLIDSQNKVVWHNEVFRTMADSEQPLIGLSFLEALGNPELISPAVLPLNMDPGPGQVLKAILKMAEKSFVAIRASRSALAVGDAESRNFTTIVVRDVSEEILENQKREALYLAGIELGDLSPEEITEMPHEDRTELLKEKILEYSQDILGFETIEIRVLNPVTNELVPLLEVGMQDEAVQRKLYAVAEDNGVTGYVAATRKSHLCRDTKADPLYITGAADARSSLTVPLIMHDEVLGTFNVESPGTQSYDQKDLEFLEVFGIVVAMALNQLHLLVAQKVTAATASSNRLRSEVALPTDDILSSATAILEKYIGHDPDVCEQLQQIVDNTRKIRGQIERVSEEVETTDAGFHPPISRLREERPQLKGKRILVVDSDASVLTSAHDLLDRHSCSVETVRSGKAACQMARSHHYDAVLCDIRLPDMTGYECFCQLQEIDDHLPVILMTGFGYDAGHSIVKCRQRGLKAVLYKPFRREQLLTEVEKAVTPPPPHE